MYRSLDSNKIIRTAEKQLESISKTFPDAGLRIISTEVVKTAIESKSIVKWTSRSIIPIRVGMILLILIFMASTSWLGIKVHFQFDYQNLSEFTQFLEATINILVLCGAGFYFLVTLDTRLKRRKVQSALSQLRSLAHVIDMHQLRKDPELLSNEETARPYLTSNTELLLYFDYCCDMLAIIGKIAALYVQHLNDSVILASVNDIESLTSDLSMKIWQKINMIHTRTGGRN